MAKKKLTDDEMLSVVRGRLEDCWSVNSSSWWQSEASTALDYYYRRPRGDEQLERSTYISSDVKDVIETSIPGMIEVFASADDAVQFEAAPADEQRYKRNEIEAKEANAAIKRTLWHDNPGFLILHNWLKDAAMVKNGIVGWWWEEIDHVEEESVQGVPVEQLMQVQGQEGIEIVAYQEYMTTTQGPDGAPIPIQLADATIRKTSKKGKVCIENIPMHEFVPDKNARNPRPADMAICAHVTKKSLSDLREAGLIGDEDDIEDYAPPSEFQANWNNQQRNNAAFDDEYSDDDKSLKLVWVHNVYMRLDADGDGIAELRNVKYVGNRILENNVVDHIPFASYTPTPLPHQFNGMSLADDAMDIQDINTSMMRATFDAVYMSNEPRMMVGNGVELDDLLTVRPNGTVRMNGGMDQLAPLVVPNTAIQYAPMIVEMMQGVKEGRTGYTKYNQGLDSKSLNKTASGINMIFNASQQRERLRARIFAEIGLKDLYWGIIKTLKNYSYNGMYAKVDGQQTLVDPRKWSMGYDITINVGLGAGNKDQMLGHLSMVQQAQITAIQMGALDKLVTMKNIYNTQVKVLENMGIKTPGDYWTDPATAQPEQPKPDPEMEKAKMQGEIEIKKVGMQGDIELRKAGMHQQTELEKKRLELMQRQQAQMYGPYSGMPGGLPQ